MLFGLQPPMRRMSKSHESMTSGSGRRCLLCGVGGAPESTTRQSPRRPVVALSAVSTPACELVCVPCLVLWAVGESTRWGCCRWELTLSVCRTPAALLCFVAGKTCRRVAEFLEGPKLSLLCASPVEQPLLDPGLGAVGSSEATAGSCAGGLNEDSDGSATASQCSPAPHCSLCSSRASRQSGTTNSKDDPCAPDKVHDFAHCFHSRECTEERCRCARTGLACEKTCGCAQYRWTAGSPSSAGLGSAHSIGDSFPAPGSRLSGRHIWRACVPPSRCDTDECPCFAVDRECDPDACHTCGAHWHPSTGVDGVPHSPDDGVHRAGAQVLRGAGLLIAADVESGVSLPEAL